MYIGSFLDILRSSHSEEDVSARPTLHLDPGPSAAKEYQRMAYTPEAKRTPHTFLHHQRGSSNPFDSSTPPLDSSFSTPLDSGKPPPLSSTPRRPKQDEKPKPETVGTNPFGEDDNDEEVSITQDNVDQGQEVSVLQEDMVEQEKLEEDEKEERTTPVQTPTSLKPTESTSTLKTDDNGLDDVTTTVAQHEEGIKHRMSVAFRQELLAMLPLKTDSRIGLEVAKLSDPDLDVIRLFARCLPYVVPNVILAKREVR